MLYQRISFLLLYMYIYFICGPICIYVHMCMFMHVHMYVETRGQCSLPQSLLALISETTLLTELGAHRFTSKPWGFFCPCLLRTGITGKSIHGMLVWVLGTGLGSTCFCRKHLLDNLIWESESKISQQKWHLYWNIGSKQEGNHNIVKKRKRATHEMNRESFNLIKCFEFF